MADTKAAPTDLDLKVTPPEIFQHVLTADEGQLILKALLHQVEVLADTANDHQRQIDNPSFMNPQPEMHQAALDAATVEGEQVLQLMADLCDTLGLDANIYAMPQVQPEPQPTVEGPAEHNRPGQARQGPRGAI